MAKFNTAKYNQTEFNSPATTALDVELINSTYSLLVDAASDRTVDLLNVVSTFTGTVFSLVDYNKLRFFSVSSFTNQTGSTSIRELTRFFTQTSYSGTVNSVTSRILTEFETLSSYSSTVNTQSRYGIRFVKDSFSNTVNTVSERTFTIKPTVQSFTNIVESAVDAVLSKRVISYASTVASFAYRKTYARDSSITEDISTSVDNTIDIVKNIAGTADGE